MEKARLDIAAKVQWPHDATKGHGANSKAVSCILFSVYALRLLYVRRICMNGRRRVRASLIPKLRRSLMTICAPHAFGGPGVCLRGLINPPVCLLYCRLVVISSRRWNQFAHTPPTPKSDPTHCNHVRMHDILSRAIESFDIGRAYDNVNALHR